MNKIWGRGLQSEEVWPPTKWSVCNFEAKHLFMQMINKKKGLRERSGSDCNREIRLMDHSLIDWLNTGIYLPLTRMHINQRHHFYSVGLENNKKKMPNREDIISG